MVGLPKSNFAYAFLLLPKRKRQALKAVYQFCRAVDDAVDEVKDTATGLKILADWREELSLIYQGRPRREFGSELGRATQSFGIRQKDLEDILAGVEMDLTTHRYQTFEDLYRYCYRVASAVGLVAIEIFGYQHQDTRRYAELMGIALQLTNILRDVGEDAGRGRIYLPLEDLHRFSVTEAEVLAGIHSDRFVDLMSFEAGRAHRYFELTKQSLPKSARRKLGTAEAMGGIYFKILQAMEGGDFRVFERRTEISTQDKLKVAARCLVAQAW